MKLSYALKWIKIARKTMGQVILQPLLFLDIVKIDYSNLDGKEAESAHLIVFLSFYNSLLG